MQPGSIFGICLEEQVCFFYFVAATVTFFFKTPTIVSTCFTHDSLGY